MIHMSMMTTIYKKQLPGKYMNMKMNDCREVAGRFLDNISLKLPWFFD